MQKQQPKNKLIEKKRRVHEREVREGKKKEAQNKTSQILPVCRNTAEVRTRCQRDHSRKLAWCEEEICSL